MDPKKTLSPEEQKARLAINKFYSLVPDATLILYKLAKFAEAEPEKFNYMRNLLDKEVSKIKK